MSASLLVFNSPLRLGWKNNAAEALNLGLFAVFAWYSIVQFRRNNRVYAFVMVTALIYGVSLELMGMATVNLYTQGPFTVMLNFPVIPLFEGTTAMPLYVSIYYPVIFMTGFKVLEGLGIATRWRAAVAGGLFLICQEAPFVIQGGLTDVRWFTWRHDPMLQFFMGWPLVDMYWQITWGTVFFYLVLRARANIDGAATAQRWSTGRALGLWAPVVAAAVIVVGCILFAPIILAKVTIGRHWPVLAVLVAGYLVVTVTALRAAQPRRGASRA